LQQRSSSADASITKLLNRLSSCCLSGNLLCADWPLTKSRTRLRYQFYCKTLNIRQNLKNKPSSLHECVVFVISPQEITGEWVCCSFEQRVLCTNYVRQLQFRFRSSRRALPPQLRPVALMRQAGLVPIQLIQLQAVSARNGENVTQ
jgi:hypothetical protein